MKKAALKRDLPECPPNLPLREFAAVCIHAALNAIKALEDLARESEVAANMLGSNDAYDLHAYAMQLKLTHDLLAGEMWPLSTTAADLQAILEEVMAGMVMTRRQLRNFSARANRLEEVMQDWQRWNDADEQYGHIGIPTQQVACTA